MPATHHPTQPSSSQPTTARSPAPQEARRALPNAAELQAATDEATWAKETVQRRLKESLAFQQKALGQYEQIMDSVDDATKIANSAQAVAAAVEYSKLERIGRGLAGGVMGCIAAATSPIAGSTLVGVDFGALIGSEAVPAASAAKRFFVSHIARRGVPPALVKHANSTGFVEAGARVASTGAGVFLAYRGRQLALLCSGALIGAKLMVDSLSGVTTQLVARFKLERALQGAGGQLETWLDKLDNLDGKVGGRPLVPPACRPLMPRLHAPSSWLVHARARVRPYPAAEQRWSACPLT